MIFQVGFMLLYEVGMNTWGIHLQLYDECSYLVYCEDISKTNQGGLSSRKKTPKEVYWYANELNPTRYFVQLYKLYTQSVPQTGQP